MLPIVHDTPTSPDPSILIRRRALSGLGLIALIAAGLSAPAAAQRVFRDYEDGAHQELTDEDIRRLSIEQNRRQGAARDEFYDGRNRPPGVRDDDDIGPPEDDDIVEYDDEDDDGRRTYDRDDEDNDEIYEPEDRSDGGLPERGRLTDTEDDDERRFDRDGRPSDREPHRQSGPPSSPQAAPSAKPPVAASSDPSPRPQQVQKPGWKPAMGSGRRQDEAGPGHREPADNPARDPVRQDDGAT